MPSCFPLLHFNTAELSSSKGSILPHDYCNGIVELSLEINVIFAMICNSPAPSHMPSITADMAKEPLPLGGKTRSFFR